MLTSHHPVNFADTRQELGALFRYAREHDIERGGRYDACSAAINLWSHHWAHPATQAESETIGTFYFHWVPTLMLWAIEADEGFALADLMQSLGRLELQALGDVKHRDVPREGRDNMPKLTMVYWKAEHFWLGKLLEHPEIMTQGESLEELEDNLKDAYRLLVLDDVPQDAQMKELIL